MEKNNFGMSFSDMFDSNTMIDSDTGTIVESSGLPKEKENELDTESTNPDLIEISDEVIVDEDKSSDGKDTISDKQSSSSSLPSLKVLANALYEKGVLSELDTEKLENADEDQAELMIGLIKAEIEKNINSYKSNLPEKLRKLIENYEENVPLDNLINIESTKTRLDNITEDALRKDEALQKLIISENYKRLGMSDVRIQKRLQQFEDLEQLEEEAIDALSESKEYISKQEEKELSSAKQRKIDYEKERENKLISLKEDITKTESIIEGIKLSDREKEKIYESMTKVVDTDSNGNPMNYVMQLRARNPLGFEKLLHYYTQIGLFNMDNTGKLKPDISKIKTGAKVSAMEELNSVLRTDQQYSSGSPARENQVDKAKMKQNIESMKKLI